MDKAKDIAKDIDKIILIYINYKTSENIAEKLALDVLREISPLSDIQRYSAYLTILGSPNKNYNREIILKLGCDAKIFPTEDF